MRPAVAVVVGAAAVIGCGGGQTRGNAFDRSWSDDGGAAIDAFQRRFASTPIPVGASAAIGTLKRAEIVGVPLTGGKPWRYGHSLDCRPRIAGSVVVGIGGGQLFALDALTGAELWKRNAGGRLRGAGDDGKTTVVSLRDTTGEGSTVLAVTHEGEVVRQIPDATPIGVPAVVDGFAFLPWGGRYVTVYDLASGEETARVLLGTPTSHAFTSEGAIFFGETGATRFDDKIRWGSDGRSSTVSLPARELPGAPRWMNPGTDVAWPEAVTADKIRLYAEPSPQGDAGIAHNRYAATYRRIAIGLDAKSGAISWAHSGEADFVGGAAYDGGFALCDARGWVTLLDAQTGTVAGSVPLGQGVDACEVQADGFEKRGASHALPLAEQLAGAIMLSGAELAPMQKLLLRELSGLADETATAALAELVANARTPGFAIEDARAALEARRISHRPERPRP